MVNDKRQAQAAQAGPFRVRAAMERGQEMDVAGAAPTRSPLIPTFRYIPLVLSAVLGGAQTRSSEAINQSNGPGNCLWNNAGGTS